MFESTFAWLAVLCDVFVTCLTLQQLWKDKKVFTTYLFNSSCLNSTIKWTEPPPVPLLPIDSFENSCWQSAVSLCSDPIIFGLNHHHNVALFLPLICNQSETIMVPDRTGAFCKRTIFFWPCSFKLCHVKNRFMLLWLEQSLLDGTNTFFW